LISLVVGIQAFLDNKGIPALPDVDLKEDSVTSSKELSSKGPQPTEKKRKEKYFDANLRFLHNNSE